MQMANNRRMTTERMVLGALMTAFVVILQYAGSFIRFGPFSISLVLLPIVIGAATGGVLIGGWLGLVFGTVVLISGDAAAFLAVDPLGTVLTVLAKGIACGLAAGCAYHLLAKKNSFAAVLAAAFACPIVNTGVFMLGCLAFFMPTVTEWGQAAGFANAGAYMFLGLAGGNFLFELATNLLLSPAAVRLLSILKKKRS